MNIIEGHFKEAEQVLQSFLKDKAALRSVKKGGDILTEAFKHGGKAIACGNGGSMCDAMHFAEELAGKFRHQRPPLPAVAISDPSYLTCTANDFGYEHVFSRYVDAWGQKGDVLLAISTSGNSPNVVKAMHSARSKAMKIIALTGKDGGVMTDICDVEIRAPLAPYADRAQEIHIKVIHALIDYIEHQLFGKPK